MWLRTVTALSMSRRVSPAVLALCMAMVPVGAFGESITLRFSGSADLSPFGGAAAAAFNGTVTWDPWGAWTPQDGCPDFCLDGSPDAVSGTFVLESVSYTDRIDPSSRLNVLGFGALVLDLFFAPQIDLDGAAAPDLGYVGVNLWSHPPDHSILTAGKLPYDLAFLGHLNDRFVDFGDEGWWGPTLVHSNTLEVVAEPSSMVLALSGLGVGLLARRRRRPIESGVEGQAQPKLASSADGP